MRVALVIISLLAIGGWFAFCVKLVMSKWKKDDLEGRIKNLQWARKHDKEGMSDAEN